MVADQKLRIILDKLYGRVEISEPVLIELLNSKPLLRLKGISQFGVPDQYFHKKNYSRFEHSVGVMLVLRRLGASIEEQVAGLLHDVSHLTFSHVIDWVVDKGQNGSEDLQDEIFEEFISYGAIAEIFKRHDLSIERLLDEKNFPLLERKIPDLCADRIDYALKELQLSRAKSYLDNIMVYNNKIVFIDLDAAINFSIDFLNLQTNHWGGYEAVTRYELFSRVLKRAIAEGIISKEDFYNNEGYIVHKLEQSKVEEIKSTLALLKNRKLQKTGNAIGKKVVKKFRYVDPLVLINGKLEKISHLSINFTRILAKHKEINQQGIYI